MIMDKRKRAKLEAAYDEWEPNGGLGKWNWEAFQAGFVAAATAEGIPQSDGWVAKTGIELIADERQRQIDVEGWTPEHDAEHNDRSIARVAVAYVEAANTIASSVEWLVEKGPEFAERMYPDKADEVKANLKDNLADPIKYTYGRGGDGNVKTPRDWPSSWDASWWKPSVDPIRNLVKAGALIAAEIDRIQRLEAHKSEGDSNEG